MRNKKAIIFLVFWVVILAIIFAFVSQKKDSTFSDNQKKEKCGIENCHGMEISCGKNVPESCTEQYKLGDACRQYARCEIQEGKCQLSKSEKFDKCKKCVEKCEADLKDNVLNIFGCESNCHKKINGTQEAVLN